MTLPPLRIATRQSPLALWQAEFVRTRLQLAHPGLVVELLPMTTKGDRIIDSPLAKIGGKGLFVKELETALLEGRADIAVHSMKDVPMEFPDGLGLGVICARENPADAFVSNRYDTFAELPQGAVVGTSSLRRQCQLRALRPDLQIADLRGNVNTRLAKLDSGEFDAIVLACAGLMRLGFAARISEALSVDTSLPAGGQGAVGIELRSDDHHTRNLLQPLHDHHTAVCVQAERAMNRHLQGGCQVPIAAFAQWANQDDIVLDGLVGKTDGSEILRIHVQGSAADPEALGERAAAALLAQGAGKILAQLYNAG